MKAFDVANDTSGRAHDIQAAGYGAVGLYLRSDRASKAMVDGLHSVGVKCFSVYEKGNPTTPAYFTAYQGIRDASAAIVSAQKIGQPKGSIIFAAIDYDSHPSDVHGYVVAFHDALKAHGYLTGIYGNGVTIAHFIDLGYCNKGWLSQSKGFAGYAAYKPHAAIIQGPQTTVLGWDVDLDTVVDESVLW